MSQPRTLTKFVDGKLVGAAPCVRCGGTERYMSGHCAGCARARAAKKSAAERAGIAKPVASAAPLLRRLEGPTCPKCTLRMTIGEEHVCLGTVIAWASGAGPTYPEAVDWAA